MLGEFSQSTQTRVNNTGFEAFLSFPWKREYRKSLYHPNEWSSLATASQMKGLKATEVWSGYDIFCPTSLIGDWQVSLPTEGPHDAGNGRLWKSSASKEFQVWCSNLLSSQRKCHHVKPPKWSPWVPRPVPACICVFSSASRPNQHSKQSPVGWMSLQNT